MLIGKWAAKVAAKAASGKGEFPACLALGDLLGEEGAGRIEVGDGRGTEQGDEAVLEGAEATFDFPLGLRVRGDAVGDAQAEQGALELGAHIVGAGVRAEGPELAEGVAPKRERPSV